MKYWNNQDKELNKMAWNRNEKDFGHPITPGAVRYQRWLDQHPERDNRWIGIPEPDLRKPERNHWRRRHRKPHYMQIRQNNDTDKAINMIHIMLSIIVMLVTIFLLFFVATRK